MVITSIITVKEEGKERGGEAVREDGGVVVAIHLDPRVAVVRRHNPENENDHGGDCDDHGDDRDDQGGDRDDSDREHDYGVDPRFTLHIIMVKMGWMVMP